MAQTKGFTRDVENELRKMTAKPKPALKPAAPKTPEATDDPGVSPDFEGQQAHVPKGLTQEDLDAMFEHWDKRNMPMATMVMDRYTFTPLQPNEAAPKSTKARYALLGELSEVNDGEDFSEEVDADVRNVLAQYRIARGATNAAIAANGAANGATNAATLNDERTRLADQELDLRRQRVQFEEQQLQSLRKNLTQDNNGTPWWEKRGSQGSQGSPVDSAGKSDAADKVLQSPDSDDAYTAQEKAKKQKMKEATEQLRYVKPWPLPQFNLETVVRDKVYNKLNQAYHGMGEPPKFMSAYTGPMSLLGDLMQFGSAVAQNTIGNDEVRKMVATGAKTYLTALVSKYLLNAEGDLLEKVALDKTPGAAVQILNKVLSSIAMPIATPVKRPPKPGPKPGEPPKKNKLQEAREMFEKNKGQWAKDVKGVADLGKQIHADVTKKHVEKEPPKVKTVEEKRTENVQKIEQTRLDKAQQKIKGVFSKFRARKDADALRLKADETRTQAAARVDAARALKGQKALTDMEKSKAEKEKLKAQDKEKGLALPKGKSADNVYDKTLDIRNKKLEAAKVQKAAAEKLAADKAAAEKAAADKAAEKAAADKAAADKAAADKKAAPAKAEAVGTKKKGEENAADKIAAVREEKRVSNAATKIQALVRQKQAKDVVDKKRVIEFPGKLTPRFKKIKMTEQQIDKAEDKNGNNVLRDLIPKINKVTPEQQKEKFFEKRNQYQEKSIPDKDINKKFYTKKVDDKIDERKKKRLTIPEPRNFNKEAKQTENLKEVIQRGREKNFSKQRKEALEKMTPENRVKFLENEHKFIITKTRDLEKVNAEISDHEKLSVTADNIQTHNEKGDVLNNKKRQLELEKHKFTKEHEADTKRQLEEAQKAKLDASTNKKVLDVAYAPGRFARRKVDEFNTGLVNDLSTNINKSATDLTTNTRKLGESFGRNVNEIYQSDALSKLGRDAVSGTGKMVKGSFDLTGQAAKAGIEGLGTVTKGVVVGVPGGILKGTANVLETGRDIGSEALRNTGQYLSGKYTEKKQAASEALTKMNEQSKKNYEEGKKYVTSGKILSDTASGIKNLPGNLVSGVGKAYTGVGDAYTATRERARTLKQSTGQALADIGKATGATYVGTKAAKGAMAAARELYKRQDYKKAVDSAKALTTDKMKQQRDAAKATMLIAAEKAVKDAKEAVRKLKEDFEFYKKTSVYTERGANDFRLKIRAADDNVQKKDEFFQRMRQANPNVSFGGGTEEKKEKKEKKEKRKPTTLRKGYPRSRRASNSKAKAKTRKGRRRFSHSMVH